jgi:hypothetical protein
MYQSNEFIHLSEGELMSQSKLEHHYIDKNLDCTYPELQRNVIQVL